MRHFLPALLTAVCLNSLHAALLPKPAESERIILIGGGLGERMVYYGHFESELHLRYPGQKLIVRNMCRPGNTPGFRPHPSRTSQWAFPGAEKFHPKLQSHHGKGFYPTPDQWLTEFKSDTLLALFGYNESFDGPEGADNFGAELEAFIKHTLAQKYNGKSAPRLVLVSPIAFENLTPAKDLPDGRVENTNLALYTSVMKRVAAKNNVPFVDLFHPTLKLYKKEKQDFTINGFAPSDHGYRQLAKLLTDAVWGEQSRKSKSDSELVRKAVLDKDWLWTFADYQILNGVHVHGQRHKPFGPANYPDELKKTREMTTLRDLRIHEIAQGKEAAAIDDAKTHPLPPVQTNFKRPITYLKEKEAVEKFTMEDGYKIELFASEHEFPNLRNPVQMSFDNKGRLWVAVLPSYPHYRPGDERPDDKLIILEDTDNDGRADKETIFADGLHLPIGFELAPEGVYVSQEPNLCLLVDDNNDDRADRMEILVHGFDSHDTHHAISAYCADASGAFFLCEGRFLHSQVETPYGPQRCNDGGIWRFDPKNWRLERYSQTDYSNPWGVALDDWGQVFISDASGGANWYGLPLSVKVPYGYEIAKVGQFAPKRSRPTSGSEFVFSRHFPDEVQGDFMLSNSIGFLGTTLWDVEEEGAGFVGKVRYDLLSSSDPNFRPVDIEFAPDGSLYLVDWHNALIGHMQHNARDPNRDHDHGRIYRITYPARPLVKPAQVAGASIPTLLDNLKLPEYRTRYRTRRELRGRPAAEVLPAVRKWVAALDSSKPRYEHHLVEGLWATWAQNQVDVDLLTKCLSAKDHRARAAAVTVLRYAGYQIANSTDLLMKAAGDDHPRVRLAAMVAASWLDNTDGARIALEGFKHPITKWMEKACQAIMVTLGDNVQRLDINLADYGSAQQYLDKAKIAPVDPAKRRVKVPKHVPKEFRSAYQQGFEIYARDGHCKTCHQDKGQGLPPAFPPITNSPWVTGSEERLIKLTLKGMIGPLQLNGQKFDGAVPMTPFGGMLKDHEIAAVLTYVRNSFGNVAPGIKASTVKKVREATKDKLDFYTPEQLLKEHPLEK